MRLSKTGPQQDRASYKIMKRLILITILLIGGYFALPTVSNLVANMVWKSSPAPWESVAGMYFPEGARGAGIESPRFSSLKQCRNWAAGMASMHTGYSSAARDAQWVCGWGILRFNDQTGVLSMRDFIQSGE